MKPERQKRLKKKNNIAWRPDNLKDTLGFGTVSNADRQLRLDPDATEVDSYDPKTNPTGNDEESADQRNIKVKVDPNSPYLRNDARTNPKFKSANQKARERGWGEVFFDSYGPVLNLLETQMNAMFSQGKLNPAWQKIVSIDPKQWQATASLPPLGESDLKQIANNCWFPVHACGYNWLQSNGDSAMIIAKRIDAIMADYNKKHMQCEKVIVVTHSMGGLVGRALCHSAYGNLQDKILGIVHGVMPAMGLLQHTGGCWQGLRLRIHPVGVTKLRGMSVIW